MQEKNLASLPAFLLSSFDLSYPFKMNRDNHINSPN